MWKIICFLIACLIVSCSNEVAGGGATSVGNGYVAIQIEDGTGVQAVIAPFDYNPLEDNSDELILRTIPEDEIVIIDSLDEESEYSLMITTDSTGLFYASIPLNDTMHINLKPLGTLIVPVDSKDSAGLIGSNLVGDYDSAASAVIFSDIPSGLYDSLVLSSKKVYDSITVIEDEVTVVDTGDVVVGNYIALEIEDGAGAQVIIAPYDFNPLIDIYDKLILRTISETGKILIDSLVDTSKYSLTVLTDSTGLFISNFSMNNTIRSELKPLSALIIPVTSTTKAGFFGTNLVGAFDNSRSEIVFNGIPSGLYDSLIFSSSEVFGSVKVLEDKETILDTGNIDLTIYKVSLPDQMKNDTVLAVEPTIHGLYMGTSSGLHLYDFTKFSKPYDDQITLGVGAITNISSTNSYIEAIGGELTLAVSSNSHFTIRAGTVYEPNSAGSVPYAISTDSIGGGYAMISVDTFVSEYDATSLLWDQRLNPNVTAIAGARDLKFFGFADGTVKVISRITTTEITFEVITTDVIYEEPHSDTIVSLVNSPYGIYIGSTKAIYRHNDSSKAKKLVDVPFSPGHFAEDDKNRVWFRYDETGIAYIEDEMVTLYSSFLSNQYRIVDICYKAGKLYIACSDKGIVVVEL